ncbi:Zinc ABC transporter periplasmic-binding protein ZnuA [Furfurilactobacillus rossiae]|nr:Zinc ABC transporter periplasmic-binding protein ZnuA [Furfurilactobacillus rossiae]QLE63510.1 Zinc ABC transporter periplasmic-binding protein ZnuA [Furfurilactobacillus rossiae]
MRSHKRVLHILSIIALLLVTVTVSIAVDQRRTVARTTSTTKIRVVSSLDFYAQAASAVLGQYGQVTAVINSPSVDAESFEPTTHTAKQVAKADVIIENGLGYDDWLGKVVAANGQEQRTINVGTDLMHRRVGENPHIWYNPQAMPRLVAQMVTRFSSLQPEHKATFKRNANRYLKTLAPWKKTIKQLKRTGHHQAVAVSEPVFNDTLTAVNLKISDNHFARAVEEGTDPSPADIAKLTRDFKQHRVALWVVNTQNSQPIVNSMTKQARRYHIPVVQVTETLPSNQSYVRWMTNELNQVKTALEEDNQHGK